MDVERLREYWEGNKLQVIVGLLGLFLLIGGLGWIVIGDRGRESSIEIISTDESSPEKARIVVDVAGAVVNPGVYELDKGARVNDALVAAGGFAKEADRVWVRRYVNLAQIVPDGVKLYIPAEGETHSNQITNNQIPITNSGEIAGETVIGLGVEQNDKVDINTASKSELDALWGIGEKRAEAIINNRPYNTIEELLTKAGIPQNIFERIEAEIVVY